MTKNRIKLALSLLVLFPLIGLLACGGNTPRGVPSFENAEATYKARCQICHSPKAEKLFNPTKDDGLLVEAILKGNSAGRPPMPSFAAEGMTAEQARALVAHMKRLAGSGKQ